MKNLLVSVFLLAATTVTAQNVTSIFEFESTDEQSFKQVLDIWAPTLEKGLGQDLPPTYVFAEQGTRTYFFSQEFGSLSDWAAYQEKMEERDAEIGKAFQESEMTPELFQSFNQSMNAHELSLWKFMPELSTVDAFMEMSAEERDALPYRRITYVKTDMNQQNAFEEFIKKNHEMDARLGVEHIFAVYRSETGARDMDYLMVVVDKSRFDYHRHWEARMKTRNADAEFQEAMQKMGSNPWTVVDEKHLMRINELTY